jgi:cell division transport system permease protein
LQYLDKNPLPAVFLVQPKSINTADITHTQDLVTAIAELNAVDEVQIDMLWMQRLLTITEISQKLVLAIGIALGVGVLLVIGNTIRLAIQSRRDEIIVVKLVGGTDAYVRRPFLYTGLLLGLLGAMMASLMLVTCVVWLGAICKCASRPISKSVSCCRPWILWYSDFMDDWRFDRRNGSLGGSYATFTRN